ncbi:MAG: glucosamine-6-phosphate deaminase [Spirochaetaceae bacterium]|jgi:6-phosphogluconolactonase/glucosamine-6-phosphate isomerase/deaminase|nr:glucosamine-6-phosphate deaminase [Spirochaetaceae bacterium]
MKIIVAENFEHMSRLAADLFIGEACRDGRVNVSITSGNTPLGAYSLIIDEMAKVGGFKNVHYYNFDEIPILNPEGKFAFYLTLDFLTKVFYGPASVSPEQIHHLNEKNYQDFEGRLASDGGIDLMLMGLGGDGHFCGNMPQAARFNAGIYKVNLSDEYSWFKAFREILGENTVKEMVTMGPRTVLGVKRLVMIVNGKQKAEILKKCVEGEVTESIPASVLKLHHNFTLIADREAASMLDRAVLQKYA